MGAVHLARALTFQQLAVYPRCFGDVGRKTFKSYPVSLVDGGSSLELTCFYGTPPQMKITWARGHGFYFPRRGVVCSKQ